MRTISSVILVVVVTATAGAQKPTLLDRARESHRPVNQVVFEPLSAVTSLADVLNDVDLVVRGRIAMPPVSYLSPDGQDVRTDYRIDNTQIIYESPERVQARRGRGPEGPVIVTQLGGSVNVDGNQISVVHRALPPLPARGEYIFLLQRRGDKNFIAHDYLGVFAVLGDSVMPPNRDFAKSEDGKSVEQFVADVMNGLRAAGR